MNVMDYRVEIDIVRHMYLVAGHVNGTEESGGRRAEEVDEGSNPARCIANHGTDI